MVLVRVGVSDGLSVRVIVGDGVEEFFGSVVPLMVDDACPCMNEQARINANDNIRMKD